MNNMKRLLALCAVGATGVASAVNVVGDANAKTTYFKDKTVITVTQGGTLTVTEPGEIEILVVGGGGGGGGRWSGYDSNIFGGAGGAGGVIHKTAFAVTAGDYPIVIGAGGVVNVWSPGPGGATTAFGLTAYGGGYGAMANARNGNAGSGASGGGGAKATGWDGTTTAQPGVANKSSYGNLGHDGAAAPGSCYAAGGGGGGAGGAAEGSAGGIGYLCSISGEEKYYAGGGYAGSPTADYGGGNTCYGGGGHWSGTGGNGVVIVSFTRTKGTDSVDFALSGGNKQYLQVDGTALAFTEDGTLTVTGEGQIEVLLVGGGGGGGQNVADGSGNSCYGGGGGGGGLIHLKNIPVSAGSYQVTVGAGGAVSETGSSARSGNSTFLGLTAWGGGFGAKGLGYMVAGTGGSGGGGTIGWSADTKKPGAAVGHTAIPDLNLANAGADASDPYKSGAGGGAGGAAVGTKGGDGYACSITGEEVRYATGGGGGGGYTGVAGLDGLGGGGGPNAKGGSGVVIVRYAKTDYQTVFADATGGKIRHCRDAQKRRCTVHTFTQNGTFSLPHAGLVEILMVGGGGGGGGIASGQDSSSRAGGGGGGGVIHKQGYILPAGEHSIVIGQGGIKNMGVSGQYDAYTGGATTAFDMTAYGGGYGAMSLRFTVAGSGASGGGGSKDFNGNSFPGGAPSAVAVNAGNLGNRGGDPVSVYGGGGGGGGAGTAANAAQGGDGYPCSITGTEVYYGGGGGGNGSGTNGKGGGTTGIGGGGCNGASGGAGIVIVRYQSPETGLMIIVK